MMAGAAGVTAAKNKIIGDVVTVSGQTIFAFAFGGGNADAHLKVDNDGNMYSQSNFGGYVQFDTVADWLRPTTSAPGLYQVRYTNHSGDVFISETAAEDVWHPLSSGDFILRLRQLGGGFNFAQAIITIEIRLGTGPVLDSALFTLNADTEL